MRPPKVPDGAITVTRFTDFEDYRDRFFAGLFQLLIVLGGPGRSKSWTFKTMAEQTDEHGKPRAHVIKGYARPYQVYKELYWHQDEKIILDDAEPLWRESSGTGRQLVRQLTELEDPTEVSWMTANKDLDAEGIPRRFETRSKLVIICNEFFFGTRTEDLVIRDRGIVLHSPPRRSNSTCTLPAGTGIRRFSTTSAAASTS